ncbi:metallophos domain-containing protein [Caerostris darwini]|uniref:Metallophos domain-containing protein n=1 Tax=Caerostris darwini TaxID=1538125 RepID=A0AAV4N3B0_9ARAC|nr:metallophos domain-containing protein [Caerostris darwini]
MVSLVVCVLNAINRLIPKPTRRYFHNYNIPFPQVMHKHLDSSFIEQFEEILVIGDVHGCCDELEALLEKANAAGDNVLKLLVGDLVNKGPKNSEVLNLVRQSKSILSVRGNHDEVVLKEYFDSKNSDYRLKEKNLWIKDLSNENINYLTELPYTISLPTLNCIIVHAGLVPGVPVEINEPMHLVRMRNIIMTDYFWEEGLLPIEDTNKGEPWSELWGGPQHVYFGHDARRMLQKRRFATGLDTGCVYGNSLTGVFISGCRKGEFIQVKAKEAYSKKKSKKD